ncbi:hypothetical protein ACYPKM_00420 [Pseudomonas aeruginosa]
MNELVKKTEKVMLPKQWKHWCRIAGLRVQYRKGRGGRKKHTLFNLVGRGFVWRVTANHTFQRGDTITRFDRWALCAIEETRIPMTKAAFVDAVESLLAMPSSHEELSKTSRPKFERS